MVWDLSVDQPYQDVDRAIGRSKSAFDSVYLLQQWPRSSSFAVCAPCSRHNTADVVEPIAGSGYEQQGTGIGERAVSPPTRFSRRIMSWLIASASRVASDELLR